MSDRELPSRHPLTDASPASPIAPTSNRPILSAIGLGKRYGKSWVLRDATIDVQPGQVLALLGENGAGKSTLVKILSGAVSPDAGSVAVDGRPIPLGRPDLARRSGIRIVYQELSVCPDMTVEDNIMLGQEQTRFGLLSRREQRHRVREVLARLGHPDLSPERRVETLSVGAQQLLEIARALIQQARVLILDEPTSSLPRGDVERLFEAVRALSRSGLAVIYISHFLEEVREICDSYLVLRDGEVAGQGPLENTNEEAIVQLMVGRSVDELFPAIPHSPGEPWLQLRQLSGADKPHAMDLVVRRGEIFGLAGLVGAGRTEALRLVYGLERAASGGASLHHIDLKGPPRRRINAGLAMVSEDRKREGLAQSMSIRDNITLSHLKPFTSGGVVREAARKKAVARLMEQLHVKAIDGDQPVVALSGGNQQKVAIARILHQDANCLLLDEPTRGVDVGTKAEIYRLMGEAAAAGKAIVFVSSYFRELLELCDTIAVMARGRIADIRPASEWSEHEMLHAAMGGELQIKAKEEEGTE